MVNRFRGGLVFKALRLAYHSLLGSRVIEKKRIPRGSRGWRPSGSGPPASTRLMCVLTILYMPSDCLLCVRLSRMCLDASWLSYLWVFSGPRCRVQGWAMPRGSRGWRPSGSGPPASTRLPPPSVLPTPERFGASINKLVKARHLKILCVIIGMVLGRLSRSSRASSCAIPCTPLG